MVQLHGDEGPSYCQEAARRTGLKIIKAARVRDAATVRALSAYRTVYHLLDAHVPGRSGGTGERFDWSLVAEHPDPTPVILAGGIRADNVREAIETVEPFALDVCSGLRTSEGYDLDQDKLDRFMAAVRGG
jgi:phosphoribosylanthranilate isomerase